MAKKIQKPEKKNQKTEIVAFKVEEDLAQFLSKLKNKSEFIRKAILAQFSMECPLCAGSGAVPRGLRDHFKPVLHEHAKRPCDRCKAPQAIPLNLDGLSDDDQARLEQFYHGGPLFCAKCYPDVPTCDDCQWHVPHEYIVEHIKKAHAH